VISAPGSLPQVLQTLAGSLSGLQAKQLLHALVMATGVVATGFCPRCLGSAPDGIAEAFGEEPAGVHAPGNVHHLARLYLSFGMIGTTNHAALEETGCGHDGAGSCCVANSATFPWSATLWAGVQQSRYLN